MKTCICCKIEKHESNFTKDKNRKDGLYVYCKDCNRIKRKNEIEIIFRKGISRVCPTCGVEKKLSEFYKTSSSCKICHIANDIKKEHKKREKKAKEEWKATNPKCLKCGKIIPFKRYFPGRRGTEPKYCSKKCSKHRHQEYRLRNIEKIKIKSKENYKKNYIKKKSIIKHKKCERCGIEYKTYNIMQKYCGDRCRINVHRNKKYKNNTLYKIESSLRGRISQALRKVRKSDSTMKLVGCTLQELKEHLEKQFKPGMTWENHNFRGWHIDHIIPCSLFDLSKPKEQKKCFHYTNLQPLWWLDNIKKGNKI